MRGAVLEGGRGLQDKAVVEIPFLVPCFSGLLLAFVLQALVEDLAGVRFWAEDDCCKLFVGALTAAFPDAERGVEVCSSCYVTWD